MSYEVEARDEADAPALLSEDAASFVRDHPADVVVTDSGKVKFLRTGMEFSASCSRELLTRYYNGRAMRRALVEEGNAQFDFDALKPNIVPHKEKNPEAFLYCRLTHKVFPKNALLVEKHCNGRKYIAALKRQKAASEERSRVRCKRVERAAARAGARAHSDNAKTGYDSSGDSGSEMKEATNLATASGNLLLDATLNHDDISLSSADGDETAHKSASSGGNEMNLNSADSDLAIESDHPDSDKSRDSDFEIIDEINESDEDSENNNHTIGGDTKAIWSRGNTERLEGISAKKKPAVASRQLKSSAESRHRTTGNTTQSQNRSPNRSSKDKFEVGRNARQPKPIQDGASALNIARLQLSRKKRSRERTRTPKKSRQPRGKVRLCADRD